MKPRGPVSRGRLSTALRHPLVGLLVAVAVIGMTWALLVPPWQSPDEVWHFAYAESLAERFALPNAPGRPSFSSAESLAVNADHASAVPFYSAQVRPDWNAGDFRLYLAEAAAHPSGSDGGGFNTETANPPLLYLYDDLAYWVSGGNAFDRLYAMRMWNVSLLLATVIGAWLLAGEVFRRRRLAQVVCAAVVGLIPMQTFILTSVNPDALLVPLWTLALWLGARVITRRARMRDVAGLFALTAAAILTKATGYALVPSVVVAVGAGLLRRPADERRGLVKHALLASPVLLVPVFGWVGLSEALGRPVVNQISSAAGRRPASFRVPQFMSYVWQFYLPRLPFMPRFSSTSGLSGWEIWLKGAWGRFGYLDVQLPSVIYALVAAVTGLVGVATVGLLARVRDRGRLLLLAYFAVALLSLLLLLHISDYRSIIAGDGQLAQGRYLLPFTGLFGLAAAFITGRLPARWRPAMAGAMIAGLLLLQVVALTTVAKAYFT